MERLSHLHKVAQKEKTELGPECHQASGYFGLCPSAYLALLVKN